MTDPQVEDLSRNRHPFSKKAAGFVEKGEMRFMEPEQELLEQGASLFFNIDGVEFYHALPFSRKISDRR